MGVARDADDPSSLTKLGVDETSTKKGHQYVTLGVDLEQSRVIHVITDLRCDELNLRGHVRLRSAKAI